MKKFSGGILSLLILLSFAACVQNQSTTTDLTPSEISENIVKSQSELPRLSQITSVDADFSLWISDYYLIPDGQIEDGAIYYADGAEASEIAVLVLLDEKKC